VTTRNIDMRWTTSAAKALQLAQRLEGAGAEVFSIHGSALEGSFYIWFKYDPEDWDSANTLMGIGNGD
jgi:hypothetical protein